MPTEPEAAPTEVAADGLPKRFARNAAMNYAASAGNAIYTLAVLPVIVRGLGKTLFGIWSLATNLTSYLELFELGFGAATTKKVAEDADRRPDRVVTTINTSFFVLLLFGCLALVVGVGFAFAAPSWFDVPGGLTGETILAVLALAVGLSASIPGDAFGGALAGHQRFDLLSGSNLLLIVLQSIASVAVILMGGGIVELAFVTVAIGMSMHFLRWSYLRGLVPGLRLAPHLVDRSEIRSFGATSWWFLVAQLSGTAVLRIDTVVVGVMLGVRQAAVYAVGSKLAFFALRASRDLSTLFMPHATALYHRGQRDRVGAVLLDGTRVSMLTTVPVALVLTLLAGETLRVWVGPGYNGGAVILAVLAGTVAFRSLIEPTLAVLTAVGGVKTVALSVFAEAVVNVVLSIVLANVVGLEGVAYGTLLGAVIIAAPVWIYTLRLVGVGSRRLAVDAVMPHVLPASVATVVILAFKVATPTGFVWLALATVTSVAAYFAVYARFGATASEKVRARSAIDRLRSALARARSSVL